MIVRTIVSFLIFVLVCVPAIILSIPIVALLLLTKWDGRSTIFGNRTWGRATDHPDHGTKGSYWLEFNWLVLRNPVNNLSCQYLAVPARVEQAYIGNERVGDKIAGGLYEITMGPWWEIYWIRPYTVFNSRRCVRFRAGWKIDGTAPGDLCAYVFTLNPWKSYLGV
mgnify:CR=1 FL=1